MNPNDKDATRMEDMLRSTLRREDAPHGLAEQILVRAAQQREASPAVKVSPWHDFFSRPIVRWTALAAVSASLVTGTIHYRNEQRERAEGEAAKQQLMLALHIAGSKLQLVKEKVNEINNGHPQQKSDADRSRSKS